MTNCNLNECPLAEQIKKLMAGACEWYSKCSKPKAEAEAKPKPETGTFTDPRDGRTYRTVRIGSQVWMAENLAFDYAGSKCYDNKLENADIYGRLYNWETAMKVAPPGWHLPTDEEWRTLVDFVGGDKVAGTKLKATGGWSRWGNGTDDYGFSALPGGFIYPDYPHDHFFDADNGSRWWTATQFSDYNAKHQSMGYKVSDVDRHYEDKKYLLSVRCVKDEGGA
jgi:uncharacterized protein (TIGR02145 family)